MRGRGTIARERRHGYARRADRLRRELADLDRALARYERHEYEPSKYRADTCAACGNAQRGGTVHR